MGDDLIEKTREEKLHGFPVIGEIQWGVEHQAEAEAIVDAMRVALDDNQE